MWTGSKRLWRMGALALLLASGVMHGQVGEVAKSAPDIQPDSAHLRRLAEERYPRLLTERLAGTPIVTLLLNPNGAVARSALEVYKGDASALTVSDEQFARFGIGGRELRYLGVARVELPLNTVLVAFAVRAFATHVGESTVAAQPPAAAR